MNTYSNRINSFDQFLAFKSFEDLVELRQAEVRLEPYVAGPNALVSRLLNNLVDHLLLNISTLDLAGTACVFEPVAQLIVLPEQVYLSLRDTKKGKKKQGRVSRFSGDFFFDHDNNNTRLRSRLTALTRMAASKLGISF